MRAKFTDPALNPAGIGWMQLSWDESAISWQSFRDDVIGATDCSKASPSERIPSGFTAFLLHFCSILLKKLLNFTQCSLQLSVRFIAEQNLQAVEGAGCVSLKLIRVYLV